MNFRKSSKCESSSCVEVELPQWRKSSACDHSTCVEVAFWKKSPRSAETNCVEVAMPGWRRSSECEDGERGKCLEVAFTSAPCGSGGACVEVGACCGDILLRDSKHPEVEPLRFTSEEWRAFTAGVKSGEFDMPGG